MTAPSEGACYVYGTLAALAGHFDYVIFVPQPTPTAAGAVLALLQAMDNADVVIAGNGSQEGPAARLLRSLMPETAYPLSSFRAWRLPVLRRLPFATVGDSAAIFHTATTLAAHRNGARIAEVPVTADCAAFDGGPWLCKLIVCLLRGGLEPTSSSV